MSLSASILCLCLIALFVLLAAIRKLRLGRLLGGFVTLMSALALLLLAGIAVLVAGNLRSYQRLSAEQPVGVIEFRRTGPQAFSGELTYPSGEHAVFALRGDEWQIDARMLKWRAFANLIGFDAAYKLERIGGRYTQVDEERTQPHTVFALNPPETTNVWALLKRYHTWVPWVDALYGSAAYLPMADGALFEIKISQSGLLARPLNQAASDSIGSWH